MLFFLQALYDGSVDYEDGTPNTASQAAKVCGLLSSQRCCCMLMLAPPSLVSGCVDVPRMVR